MPSMRELLTSEKAIAGVRRYTALDLKTGQTTAYAANDDGDILAGIAKLYQVLSAGVNSGTTAVYVPTLARNDIAFVNATSKITAAAGLDVVKTGDIIRVRGTTNNDGDYTVATGNVATEIVTAEALVNEGAGAMITIAKQALQSNNCVQDLETGLMWMRYGSDSPAKLGAASNGLLLWTATAVAVHAAAADLQMIAGGKGSATLRIVGGAGEVLVYWPSYTYSFTGFANAVNNLFGFKGVSVTVNGADLDLVMATGNVTCIAEAAGGARAINLSCNDIWSFANSANQAEVGGYTDWRVPNAFEIIGIMNYELNPGQPDAATFPSFIVNADYKSSSTLSSNTLYSMGWQGLYNAIMYLQKTIPNYVMLVRGGI